MRLDARTADSAPSRACSATSRARPASSSSSARARTATSASATATLLRAAFAAHDGHEQGTEGDSFFVIFRRRDRRGRGGGRRAARDRRANRGRTAPRSGSGWASTPATSKSTGGDVIGYDINRTARIAAVAHGGQVLLSDATRALVAGRAARRRRPPRPRRAPAQGPARARAPGAARHRRPARRLPAAALARRAAEQPADPAHDVRRARARSSPRRSRCSARTRLLTPDRPGRHRQDAAVAPGRGGGGRRLPRRRLVRRPRAGPRPGPRRRRRSPGPSGSPTAGTAPRDRPARRPHRRAAGAARPRQLRAGRRPPARTSPTSCAAARTSTCLVTTRIALRVSGEQEYPVPGLPAPPDTSRLSEVDRLNLPRGLREFDLDDAQPVRGRPAVHRPGDGGPAGLRGHERQRAGGGRDLGAPPRHAPRDRARRGADQAPDAGPDPRPARAPPGAADGRLARPAGAAADAARRDRLELRPARRRCDSGWSTGCRCSAAASTSRWPRPCAVRRTSSACDVVRWPRRAGRPEPRPDRRHGGRRAAVRRCSRRSASTPPRCWRSVARPMRSPHATPHAMLDLARAGGTRT